MNIEVAKGEQVFDMKIYYGGQVLDVKLASFNIIKGEDGFSPIVETERTEEGHKVTITDKNGEKSFEVLDGKNGVNGKTPYIQGGYWYIDGVNTNVKAVGLDGKDGQDGKDGLNGKDGIDGKDGINGTDGKDGYTPQKGIDYFTPQEIEDSENKVKEKVEQEIGEELETKEEKLELWNDITLTEDVSRLELYNTDNGEPYQGFRKMHVAIYGKITEGLSTRLRGSVAETGGNSTFLWGTSVTYAFKADTQYACWLAEFERISENAYQSKAAQSFFENASADAGVATHRVFLYNRRKPIGYNYNPQGFIMTIEKRDASQVGTPCFLAGTNIKVWGIK